MLPDLEILKIFFFIKLFMVLLSSMGLSESFITSYQHLSLFHLTGFDGICGVSMNEVECRPIAPKYVARSKNGSTGVYSYLRLIRLVHR